MSDTKELLKKIVHQVALLHKEVAVLKEEVLAAIENGIRSELYNLLYTVHTPSSNERTRLTIEFIAKEQYDDERGELIKINTWLSHHRWSWKDKITKEWNASPQTYSEDNIFHIAKRARDQFMQSAPPPSAAEKTQVKQIIQKITLKKSGIALEDNNDNNNNNNKKKTNNSNLEKTDQAKSTKKRKHNEISNANNNNKNNEPKKMTKKSKTRQIRSEEESEEDFSTSFSVVE